MVLTHTGRTSGRTYRTPVNFALMGGELYCTAGYGRKADWYRNIAANPEVEVWLPDGWWVGVAEDVNESEETAGDHARGVDRQRFCRPCGRD